MKPGNKTILVVEDDDDVRALLVEVLTEEGWVVASACNGKDGLETLSSFTTEPCLILVDMFMPIMSGVEFREAQLKNSQWSLIPTLFLSADVILETKVRDLKLAGTLKKPFDIEKLIQIVQQHATP